MNSKQNLIVAIVAYFTLAVTASDLYQHDTNMGLLNFMSRSNNMLRENPTRSMDCFNYYIPLINEMAKQYETDYKTCLTATAALRVQADGDTLEQRNDLAKRAEASCALLSKCSESETAEGVFECHIKGSSENTKTMYAINIDASESLADLREQYRLIEFNEHKCTNDTKRAYEKNSNQAYDDLQNCMMGISEVPTAAPSTEIPSTSAAPETEPTDAPSSEVPSTTAPETTVAESAATEGNSSENSSTGENATEDNSTKDSEENEFPQEDLSRMLALRNLKHNL